MIPKNYQYIDVDGHHWPDASVGDALFYSINYAQWIIDENDSFIDVEWVIPENMIGSESYESGGEAFIKLEPLCVGSFKVIMKLTTEELGKKQTKAVPMILKVY
jgi:hypothetical protein